jgi:ankyrin repeat protein
MAAPAPGSETQRLLTEAMQLFHANDAPSLRALFARYPEMRRWANEPIASFDAPPVIHVRSRAMLDVLLEVGADINGRSRWWAGGFGILDCASPDVASYAIERGAIVDAHAAARLGRLETLRELLARDPALVRARGGDGQTPLHFASTVAVADALIDAGADIDARDVDHESTPAMYMSGDRLDVARHLVTRGCHTDLLLAAALGDLARARQHLDASPGAVRMRVNGSWFPMQNRKAGGTIYQWTLGFHASPHQIAHERGHRELHELLMARSPASLRLVEACWVGDAERVRRYCAEAPVAAGDFTAEDTVLVALAARNNRTDAVRLLLECGLPVDARGQHGGTPLHWASFHGNVDMARAILAFAPPLEVSDDDFKATPLGWAIHGSQNGWYAQSGDYAGTVTLLLEAGAARPATIGGSPAVREVLSR